MAWTPIPLAAESYPLNSTPAAQHRALNVYAEALPDGARGKFYLKSTPGLVLATTCGLGPVTASASSAGLCFVVSKDKAYRFAETAGVVGAATDLGFVGIFAADYGALAHNTIAIGLVGPVICVPPRAYVCDFTTAAVNVITAGAGNFPAVGVSSVCYLDGYYIFTVFGGEYFFTSDLLSPSVFTGLSYVRMSSQVDFLEHAVAHRGELWMFGKNTISVWYNSGDPITPFAPRTGGVIKIGCGAYNSVVELDGSLWWVGVDGVVYRTSGSYQAKRVSSHALEELLAGTAVGDLQTLRACGFTHEGHSFYALSMPNLAQTWVYDCATGLWHERNSLASGNSRWTNNTSAQMPTGWLLCDSVDGKVWSIERGTTTEKSVAVQRLAQLPALETHGPRAYMSRLEFEMETGIGGASTPVTVLWSDDGGYIYNAGRALSTGAASATKTRVFTTRLGSFRHRVLRLTSAGQLTVYSANAEIGAGDS